MGRPSLAPLRRGQILDAFEALVAREGLEGSSLEATAREAGMNRQLVLHYFGSRAALVEAAVARMLESYSRRIAERLGSWEDAERLERLIEWIFLGDFCDERSDALLTELAVRGRRDEAARRAASSAYRALDAVLVDELRKAAPHAGLGRVRRTAFLILALCFGAGDLLTLEFPEAGRRSAHDAAISLVHSLREED